MDLLILRAVADYSAPAPLNPTDDEIKAFRSRLMLDAACAVIAARLGMAWKQVWRRAETHDGKHIECGVSFRTGWLTEQGTARLAELEEALQRGDFSLPPVTP